MRLDFENAPLSIYNTPKSKSLLESIRVEVPSSEIHQLSIVDSVLGSFVRQAAGAGLLSLYDTISIGLKGEKARRCLSNLISEQSKRVSQDTSRLRAEAQKNLLSTSCITDYLGNLESGSFATGGRIAGKAIFSMVSKWSFQEGLSSIAEEVIAITKKYEDICQIYHIAFLLTVYNAAPQTEVEVKALIKETLCKDSLGEAAFSIKKRPLLFSWSTKHLTLEDNLKYRLSILSEECLCNSDLYNPFVLYRIDLNKKEVRQIEN